MALTGAQRARRYRQLHETPRQRIIRGLHEEIRFLRGVLQSVKKHPADYLDEWEDEEFELFMEQTETMVKSLRLAMNRAYRPGV